MIGTGSKPLRCLMGTECFHPSDLDSPRASHCGFIISFLPQTAGFRSHIRCKLRSENFIPKSLFVLREFNEISIIAGSENRARRMKSIFDVEIEYEIRFHAGDLSTPARSLFPNAFFFRYIFKGNFGYQSSNICINTIIKPLTWNPRSQDVNKYES